MKHIVYQLFTILFIGGFLNNTNVFAIESPIQWATVETDTNVKLYKSPGTLQFAAESNLYKALATFRSWRFTKLHIPNNADSTLTGLTATIEIDMSSVNEKTIRLTQDLKSEKYFNIKKYPKTTAKIYNVKHIGNNKYTADIDLKLKGKNSTYMTEFEVVQSSPYRVKGHALILRETYQIGMDMPSIQSEVRVLYDTELKKDN